MENVIETKNLTKEYNGTVAVDRLNLTIRRGEVFGLLGPNGSGKTTTILMLLGLTEPTSGKVRVLGFNPVRQPLEVKARVGYLPDSVGFYNELTARENLGYIARLNRIPYEEAQERIERAMERMGLAEVIDRPVGTFSHGMRQRLGVAELLMKNAEVAILDEPTLGLDPEAARDFLKMILSLKDEGLTVLLASHLLHQVQAICDRVGLFRRGRMELEGTVSELARQVLGGAYRIFVQARGDQLMERLEKLPGVVKVSHTEEADELVLETERDLRPQVARAVVEAGAELLSIRLEEPSLDDVYAKHFQESAYES